MLLKTARHWKIDLWHQIIQSNSLIEMIDYNRGPRYQLHSELDNFSNLDTLVRQSTDTLLELILIIVVEVLLDSSKSISMSDIFVFPVASEKVVDDFKEFILLCVMNALSQKISRKKSYLQEPKIVANLSRFLQSIVDCMDRHLFKDENAPLEFAFFLSSYIWEFEENSAKQSGKISNEFNSVLKQLNRAILLTFKKCDLQGRDNMKDTKILLTEIMKYQALLVSNPYCNDSEFLRSLIHHLLQGILESDAEIRNMSLNLWKPILMNKPAHVFSILKSNNEDYQELVDGFSKLLDDDGQTFLPWFNSKREEIVKIFLDSAGKTWEDFLSNESKGSAESRQSLRDQRLKKLKKRKKNNEYENQIWMSLDEKAKVLVTETQMNCHAIRQKFKVDYKVMQSNLETEWRVILSYLAQEHAILEIPNKQLRWKLDFTEAKARIRKKMKQNEKDTATYQSKSEKNMESTISSPIETHKVSPRELMEPIPSEKKEIELSSEPLEKKPDLTSSDLTDQDDDELKGNEDEDETGLPTAEIESKDETEGGLTSKFYNF